MLERTREFGVLLALGAEPGRLVRLILAEAALLGSVSLSPSGWRWGWPSSITSPPPASSSRWAMEASGVLLPSHFYSRLTTGDRAVNAALVFVLVIAERALSGVRAARLQPVEAMHHV